MAERVVLHVGAMKSGTSYVQRLLVTNKETLAGRGVLFPGSSWRTQVRAVADVLERKRVVAQPPEGAWQSLVDELAAWEGTGIVSMEFLGPAGPAKIERVVSSFPPGTVHVIVTARDLARNVPAMWQETLKNGRHRSFDDYVDAIRDSERGPGLGFWREQGLVRMCRRWMNAVGAAQVTLVTLPGPGSPPEALWQRFAAAAGVEPAGMEQPPPANESLGAVSAEVLRQLNVLLDGMDYGDYAPLVKHQLAQRILGPRRREEPAVGFDPPDWLLDRARRMVSSLRELGVRVEGDLDDLTPVPVRGVDPRTVDDGERADAAIAALAGLVRRRAAAGGNRSRRTAAG